MTSAVATNRTEYFAEPVVFKCLVENKRLIAEIVALRPNPLYYSFVVKFSDGTTIIATSTEDDEGWVIDRKEYKCYLDAIKPQLDDYLLVRHGEWEHFEINEVDEELLVWLKKDWREEVGECIHVNFLGDYRFSLRKVGDKWEAFTIRVINPQPIDHEIAYWVSKKMSFS